MSLKIIAAASATIFISGLLAVLFLFAIPHVNARRLKSFCANVHAGEAGESVWIRGSSFTRERSATELDFSVSLPSLFMRIWHCHVALDQQGQVLEKNLGCED